MDSSRNPFLGPRLAWARRKASWSSGSISMSWGGPAAAANLLSWGIGQDDLQWIKTSNDQNPGTQFRNIFSVKKCKRESSLCRELECWDGRWRGLSGLGVKISYIAYFSLFVLILLVCQLEVAAREHAHLWRIFFKFLLLTSSYIPTRCSGFAWWTPKPSLEDNFE